MPGSGRTTDMYRIEDVKILGSVIRARRKELHLSLDEASLRLGVGRRLLLELERGERAGASIGTVFNILQRLGFDVMLRSRSTG